MRQYSSIAHPLGTAQTTLKKHIEINEVLKNYLKDVFNVMVIYRYFSFHHYFNAKKDEL